MHKGGRAQTYPPLASHSGEMSTFVGHSGEMSHSLAPYTSNQTSSWELKNLGLHFQYAAHATDYTSQCNGLKQKMYFFF